jgi:hypothetical protein
VYGTPTPPRVRLFDDYGIELFSFDAIGGIEDLCLVVTNGEVRYSLGIQYWLVHV